MMNERIKELKSKSLVPIQKDGYTSWVLDEEKFAELIVRECAGVAWGIYANQEIASGIKQHFGVE